MNYKPLFLCGTARGGTNLVKAILGCNKDVILESEPFLPIYLDLKKTDTAATATFVCFGFG